MIYLDNAATTKIDDRVLEKMLPFFKEEYGNPGSIYGLGRKAFDAVRGARSQVARLFGCSSENVFFTSGGSEGNNTIIKGLSAYLAKNNKRHILVSAIEHDSVIKAAMSLSVYNFDVQFLKPDTSNTISAELIESNIRDDTGLVVVMYANNETGVINDINGIGRLCKGRGVLFFTDCVQAAGQFPIEVNKNNIDFATVASHKIHGPKGVGAIYVRDPAMISPIINGGAEQESGLRGGTENVPGIVGFGEACRLAVDELDDTMYKVTKNKQIFVGALTDNIQEESLADFGIHCNVYPYVKRGKVLNLRVDGVNGETLVLMMDSVGVCISAGSACRAHEQEPSRVLLAHGLTPNEARNSVRISFSKNDDENDLIEAAKLMINCIKTLRAVAR